MSGSFKLRIGEWISVFFIVIAGLLVFVNPYYLPEELAINWSADNIAIRFIPREHLSIFYLILLITIPAIWSIVSRTKNHIPRSPEATFHYSLSLIWMELYIGISYSTFILWNLDYAIPIFSMICVNIGWLFLYLGILLRHSNRGWFTEIRNRWTKGNDPVLRKTHRVVSAICLGIAIVSLGGFASPRYAMFMMAFLILSIFPTSRFYPMWLSRKLKSDGIRNSDEKPPKDL